jgi:hypothetical protein
MRFDPKRGQLTCDHCGNTRPMAPARTQSIEEIAIDRGLGGADAVPQEEISTATCPSCNALIEFDPDIHATECPFCATPMVVDTGAHRHIKPAAVLPFVLAEAAAHDAMADWLGALWFAPSGLRAYARKGRKMQGIYVPYWTFDADTATSYTGQRGTVYYETRTVVENGKTRTVQVAKVRWTPVSGRVARFFDDVLVLASHALPKRFTEALAPWDLSGLTPYAPAYLAGFRAEGYQVTLEDGLTEARGMMDQVIARDIRFDIGGDQQQITTARTRVSDVTFKHILLPVWTAAYKYRGRSFRFVVNGQSGRVQGERPYSAWKIAFAVVIGAIVAAGIGYVVASNS